MVHAQSLVKIRKDLHQPPLFLQCFMLKLSGLSQDAPLEVACLLGGGVAAALGMATCKHSATKWLNSTRFRSGHQGLAGGRTALRLPGGSGLRAPGRGPGGPASVADGQSGEESGLDVFLSVQLFCKEVLDNSPSPEDFRCGS